MHTPWKLAGKSTERKKTRNNSFLNHDWLVVSTPLKNISRLGWLFPIYRKMKVMFQTTNQILYLHLYIHYILIIVRISPRHASLATWVSIFGRPSPPPSRRPRVGPHPPGRRRQSLTALDAGGWVEWSWFDGGGFMVRQKMMILVILIYG